MSKWCAVFLRPDGQTYLGTFTYTLVDGRVSFRTAVITAGTEAPEDCTKMLVCRQYEGMFSEKLHGTPADVVRTPGTYAVKMHHDAGYRWIATYASSPLMAVHIVCRAENAPESAATIVKEV